MIQNNEHEKAILNLPFQCRMIYMLHKLDGFSVAETAVLLNISESEVTEKLELADEILKKVNTTTDAFEFNLIYCDSMVERVMKEIKDL